MDNCAVTCDDSESLGWAYDQLSEIFNSYCFGLQQFMSNDQSLNSQFSDVEDNSKLLGLMWDKVNDEISTKPIDLDLEANTKRKILSTVASQFDIYQYNGPL